MVDIKKIEMNLAAKAKAEERGFVAWVKRNWKWLLPVIIGVLFVMALFGFRP